MTKEEMAAVTEAQNTQADALAIFMQRTDDRIKGLETTAGRKPVGDPEWQGTSEGKAFSAYLRCPAEMVSARTAEFKDLSAGNDSQGGFLVPGEYRNEIIKGVVEISPFRRKSVV